jgi:hypothetical protein
MALNTSENWLLNATAASGRAESGIGADFGSFFDDMRSAFARAQTPEAQNQRLAEVFIRYNRGEQPKEKGGESKGPESFTVAEVNQAVTREKAYRATLTPSQLKAREDRFRNEATAAHNKRKASRGIGGLINTITSPVRMVGRVVRRQTNVISRQLNRIPVVGSGLSSVFELTSGGPLKLASSVAAGDKIDKAAYKVLKDRVKAVQDVAPYVQTVVSFVPGVGQGISGAIGAANALSKGQPITQAIIAAARGAVPGGPIATAAFDVATAAIQGKPVDEAMLQAIPLPPEQKQYIIQGVLAAKDIAMGKKVDEAIFNRGRNVLPFEAQKALDIGVALAQGQKLQEIAKNAIPAVIPTLAKVGTQSAATNALFKVGSQHLTNTPDVQRGFHIGLGTAKYKATPTMLTAIRNNLAPNETKGFDLALSTKIGMLTAKPSSGMSSKEKFGFFASAGMKGAPTKEKVAMVSTLVSHPEVKTGVIKAVKKSQEKELGFFAWLKKIVLG